MRRLLIALMLLALAAPATAQEPPHWRGAPEYDVLMRPWAFEPEVIRLRAGEPVRLRFVNQGQTTHSFSAPAFFRAAQVRRRDAGLVADGGFQLGPGERRTIALIPAPGRYGARSRNLLQRVLGMHAVIVVE